MIEELYIDGLERQVASLRAENKQLRTALERIAKGTVSVSPAEPELWLSPTEMVGIARAALDKESEE